MAKGQNKEAEADFEKDRDRNGGTETCGTVGNLVNRPSFGVSVRPTCTFRGRRSESVFVRRIPRMKEVRKEEEGDMDESQVDSATKTLRMSAFLVRSGRTAG